MLISHLHRFIFLKTRKTAGTSLEVALSKFMGPQDVIAPTDLLDEIGRLPYKIPPRNFLSARFKESPFSREKLINVKSSDLYAFIASHAEVSWPFMTHMTAPQVKNIVPPIIWEQYKKISITRHPYEVAVSQAYFNLGNAINRGKIISHEELLVEIDKAIDFKRPTNFEIYSIDGTIVADHMIRHAHFESDIRALLQQFDMQDDIKIPRFKGQYRQDKRPAAEILTPPQKARIQRIHAQEFAAFNYEP